MPLIIRHRVAAILLATTVTASRPAARRSPRRNMTGASDTEIKIGNIVPYSGPASAYGTVGKAMAAVSWRLQLFSNDPTSPPQSPLDSILSRVKLSMGFVTAVSTE